MVVLLSMFVVPFFFPKKHEMTVMVMMKINSLLLLSLFLFKYKKIKKKRLSGAHGRGQRSRWIARPIINRPATAGPWSLTDVRTAVQTSHCSKNGAPDFSALPLPKMSHLLLAARLADSSPSAGVRVGREARDSSSQKTHENETGRDRYPHPVREPVC